jgi:hypothetical protein
MNTSLRITVDELKKRMESGEDFTVIDVRKPEVWTESDTMIPESIQAPYANRAKPHKHWLFRIQLVRTLPWCLTLSYLFSFQLIT